MLYLNPLTSVALSEEQFLKGEGNGMINQTIITATKEVFQRTEFSLGRYICVKVGAIGAKPTGVTTKIQEGNQFLPYGKKIPAQMLDQIVAFFRKVMVDKINSKNGVTANVGHGDYEAMAHIVWNTHEEAYRVAIPTQEVSKASVTYNFDHLRDGDEIILDIHSHNTMGAFFSGTDNGDDRNMISISGVAGQLNKSNAAFVWRFNHGTIKYEIKDMDEIFEYERPEVEVPEEWMEKVSVRTYAATAYLNRYAAGYNPYGSGNGLGKPVNGNVAGNAGNAATQRWRSGSTPSYGRDSTPLNRQPASQTSQIAREHRSELEKRGYPDNGETGVTGSKEDLLGKSQAAHQQGSFDGDAADGNNDFDQAAYEDMLAQLTGSPSAGTQLDMVDWEEDLGGEDDLLSDRDPYGMTRYEGVDSSDVMDMGIEEMEQIAATCIEEDLKQFSLHLLTHHVADLRYLEGMGLYHISDEDDVPAVFETIVKNHVEDPSIVEDAIAAVDAAGKDMVHKQTLDQ